MNSVAVAVPHGGAGTHTLTVAVEVADELLADADGRRHVVRHVTDLAQQAVTEHIVRHVVDEVAAAHDVAADRIFAADRARHVVAARQHAMAGLLDAGLSSKEVGRLLGRDHTTVLHGAKAHRLRETDPDLHDDGQVGSSVCERCELPSLGGGRWCLEHFRGHAAARGAA